MSSPTRIVPPETADSSPCEVPGSAEHATSAVAIVTGSGLGVAIVRLSARGSWNLTLSDGREIEVGRGDPQLRLARFARLLPRIDSADPREMERADLRYTNGFALTWRAPAVISPPVPVTQAKS